MFLVHNERTKLTATCFNALAVALVAAGVFAPIAALMYGLSPMPQGSLPLSLVMLSCFAGGAFLHWLGRAMLGRLLE
jgi:protein-S-isoprenylcysteine O-methyltransferase Ste14